MVSNLLYTVYRQTQQIGGIRMTSVQHQQIESLRASGQSYAQIARTLGIPVSTIKSFYSRRSPAAIAVQKHVCKQCGAPIEQKNKSNPRLFCCDKCRALWRYHNIVKASRAKYPMICPACGSSFLAVTKTQKYCCHTCYINDRFRKDDSHG